MSSFLDAFHFMLPHEGGYSCCPADPGGDTKFGISRRAYPDLDIIDLTIADAEKIYQRDYWDKCGFAQIDSQEIANKVFDTAVNMGPKEAIMLMQSTLCQFGYCLDADGMLGPITLSAINHVDEKLFVEMFRVRLKSHYEDLITKNEHLRVFLKGWLHRAEA